MPLFIDFKGIPKVFPQTSPVPVAFGPTADPTIQQDSASISLQVNTKQYLHVSATYQFYADVRVSLRRSKPRMLVGLQYLGIPLSHEVINEIHLAKPRLAMSVLYDNRVHRYVVGGKVPSWEDTDQVRPSNSGGWDVSSAVRVSKELPCQQSSPMQAVMGSDYQVMDTAVAPQDIITWGEAGFTHGDIVSEHQVMLVTNQSKKPYPWNLGIPLYRDGATGYAGVMAHSPRNSGLPWDACLASVYLRPSLVAEEALRSYRQSRLPWDTGAMAKQDFAAITDGVAVPAILVPLVSGFVGRTSLDFVCKVTPEFVVVGKSNVRFGDAKCPTFEIPVRSVYTVLNSISMKRAVDDVPIHLLSASMSLDDSSWSWSFSGTIHYSDLSKVEPDAGGPVEVEVEINSVRWRFLVENYDEGQVFGSTDVTIRGRSVSAYLDAPYAALRSEIIDTELTAIQIAQMGVDTINGSRGYTLDSGFSLNWDLCGLLGWVVPAGAYSYQNKSPLQMIKEVAESVGGYVQSHPSLRMLSVRSKYPVASWDWWKTPQDLTIPRSIIKSLRLSYAESPSFNGVYVSGVQQGLTAFVKITGTAGDEQAPLYAHALMTDQQAARTKGINILSQGGKAAMVTVDIPMPASLGLVLPGTLLKIDNLGTSPDWRGTTRAVNVTAQWDGSAITVNQSLSIERHY